MNLLAFLRSSLVVLLLFPVLTITLACVIIFSVLVGKPEWYAWVPPFWGKSTCWLFGVELVVEGLENLPAGGCLVLFNHRSFFDIFAIQAAVPDLRFGAKIELFKIPIFGAAMKKAGVLPIARGNVQEVIKVYQEAEPRIRAGQKFGLSPEGGRNTTDNVLLPFKSGPFLFAMGAGAPIVPCVIWGSDDVWPKGALVPQTKVLKSKIRLKFLPAYSVKGTQLSDKTEIQKQVYSVMRSELEPVLH